MKRIAAVALWLLCVPAVAGIGKTAVPGERTLRFRWWPEISAPAGWQVDDGASSLYAFRALAPAGQDFSHADTVMYAKAAYKPRLVPTQRDLRDFIAHDVAEFRTEVPGLVLSKAEPIEAHGRGYRVFRFAPPRGHAGNWECVAYGEDGAFYLTFAISSRTQAGLRDGMRAFRAMVASYRPGA